MVTRIGLKLSLLVCIIALVGCGGGVNNAVPTTTPSINRATLRGTAYAPAGVSGARVTGRQASAPAWRNEPLTEADVTINNMKSDGTLEQVPGTTPVKTNGNGQYAIPNVPEGENYVIVATKNVTVDGADKSLSVKKVTSVTDSDISAGSITGLDTDAATTLTAEAMKDTLTTANTGKAESEKIKGSDLPRETLADLDAEINTALALDQASADPSVDVLDVATEGGSGADSQLSNLENTPGGADVKTKKENASTKGSVRVHVVQISSGGPPLEGATVILTANGASQTKNTDDKGNAFFDGIEVGSVLDVEVTKPGYVMAKTSQNIDRAAVVNNVTVMMTKAETNQKPVAKAGPDQTAAQGAIVTLDGSVSFDPDGDAVTYSWSQTAGPTATLSSGAASKPTFTASQAATYTFSLTVSDGTLTSEADTITVSVQSVACSANSDCDDGNALTLDSCISAGTANAACSNMTVDCAANADCDDSNPLTNDSCANPGALDAACVNLPCAIACSTGADCNDSNALTTDTCSNAGTCGAACSNAECAVACTADAGCDDGNSLTADTCGNAGTCSAECANIMQQATAVTAGGHYTCALLSGGGVRCWGYGELGNGTFTSTPTTTPVDVMNITDAVGVDAGSNHTCAVLSGGGVRCWGNNQYGQLGNGTTNISNTPVSVIGITDAVAVAGGQLHTCAVLSSGDVKCWGNNGYGAQCCGALGDGDGTTNSSTTPVSVIGITDAVAVTAGYAHTCALLSGGGVQCWGFNGYGQLGNGTTNISTTPVSVIGITDAIGVSGGEHNTCALLSGGSLRCWGFNNFGQLGNGTTTNSTTPINVLGITDAVRVATGTRHTCALLSGGSVRCWGDKENGGLGDGTTNSSTTPVSVIGITDAVTVAGGWIHTCAVLSGGGVRCWGRNAHGQLGDGTTTDTTTPVSVVGF